MTPRLLTSAQVGLYLGRSATWFLRNRSELESRSFPKPVDLCGMRWDRQAIDDWLDRQRGTPGRAPTVEDVLLDRARKMMAGDAA